VPEVAPIATITGVDADRVACGPDGAWAAAARRLLTLGDGRRLQAPRPLTGALRFSADASAMLAGTERLELATGAWADLADPLPAVAGGLGPLELTAAAWDAAGSRLVVAAERRPSRSPRAGPAPPEAWLTLIDGRTRAALRGLWTGGGLPPRWIAFEGGVVAADPDRGARLWTGEDEWAPDPGPVDGLALGDGGRLLALSHPDGRVALRRGPGFDEPSEAGTGATGPVAAAAGAPVIAWATGAGVTVLACGAESHIRADEARALALADDGRRLALLDRERTLHLFGIRG